MRSSLIRFTASAVLAVLVLSLTTLLLAGEIARSRALANAREQASNLATRLAAPMITQDLRKGTPGAASTLDAVMANRMRDGSVQRVKIWDTDGRVIWADSKDLVGQVFTMKDEVVDLFGTTKTTAEVSDLERAENVTERSASQLLEVYAGAFDSEGQPVVIEAYLSTRQMDEDARAIATSFVPLILGTLAVFLLIVLPLAYTLARRVQKAQAESTTLMRHALRAADLERRRIAHDLHDGVIQDLSGVGYLLPTVQREMHAGGDLDRARALIGSATDVVQSDVAALRALLIDLYPPHLDGVGLEGALRELVTLEALKTGMTGECVVDAPADLSIDTARLIYRIAREAVRNVVKHAAASTMRLEVTTDDSTVTVRVSDDGVGPGDSPGEAAEGHMGIRLIADTVSDLGGTLEMRAQPQGGTVVHARFPRSLAPQSYATRTQHSPRSPLHAGR